MEYFKFLRKSVGQEKIILNAANCVVINDQNEVLLHQIDQKYWSLPGGVLDLGETYESCAVREVKEETGIDVSIVDTLGIFYCMDKVFPNGDQAQMIAQIFVARATSNQFEIDGVETLDVSYFNLSELPPLKHVEHQEALAKYRQIKNEEKGE